MTILAILLIALSAMFPAQEPAETGTGRVAGRVLAVNGTGPGEPCRRAIVTLTGSTLPAGRSVITDDNGGFVLDRLPAGRFTLTATKPAYLPGAYGAMRPGRAGVALVLSAGQRVADVSIVLTRGAAIGGVIRDAAGAPLAFATVTAYRALPDGTLAVGQTTDSDDRGHYRLFGLTAGSYVVSAATGPGASGDVLDLTADAIDRKLAALRARGALPPGARPAAPPATAPAPVATIAPVFYPHVFSAADASPIALGFADDRSDIDIAIDRIHTAVVEGSISGAPEGAALMLTMSQPGLVNLSVASGPTLRSRPPGNGAFEFTGATPGHYVISARTPPGVRPVLWARADVDVTGSDVRGVGLSIQPAMHLTGRLVFDAATLKPPADLTSVRVILQDAVPRGAVAGGGGRGVPQSSQTTTDSRGNFDLDDVVPGTYWLVTSMGPHPAGWWLRSAMVNGRDALDVPLAIDPSTPLAGAVLTFSDRHSSLSGTLEVPAGSSAADFSIVVFPEDRAMWRPLARRIKSTRPGTDGTYVLRDLPAGQYRFAALTDVTADDLIDRTFFEALLPASIRVTIGEGEQKVLSFRFGG